MLKYASEPDLSVAKTALLSSAKSENIKPYVESIAGAPDPVRVVLLEIFAEKGSPEFFDVLMEYSRSENK